MSHTPGPWRARAGSGGRPSIIYGQDGWPVADAVTYHGRTTPEQQEANARLIAAAPELLAALRTAAICLAAVCEHAPQLAAETAYQTASQAIAKATSKQEDAS